MKRSGWRSPLLSVIFGSVQDGESEYIGETEGRDHHRGPLKLPDPGLGVSSPNRKLTHYPASPFLDFASGGD